VPGKEGNELFLAPQASAQRSGAQNSLLRASGAAVEEWPGQGRLKIAHGSDVPYL